MALSQSALLEVLDALKASDSTDVIRQALQVMLQQLIDAEATALIGAEPHERTDARTTQRNGTRPKTVTTTAGDVDLSITKLRQGSFFPSLLERRRRIDQALFAVIMEAYVTGTSVRKVDNLVKALGADTGISKSEVSRICADLDEDVAGFADRSLGEQAFPYVFLDATYCKARDCFRSRRGSLLERVNKEVKRRTYVIGVFPNPEALHSLAGCILIEIHDEWQIAERRYLSESSMALIDNNTNQEVVTHELIAS